MRLAPGRGPTDVVGVRCGGLGCPTSARRNDRRTKRRTVTPADLAGTETVVVRSDTAALRIGLGTGGPPVERHPRALSGRQGRAVRSPRAGRTGPRSMSTDTDLVRRCLDGDRLGWAELLARYGDLIYGLFHRAGLDKTSAADGFQEVSILLWKSLKPKPLKRLKRLRSKLWKRNLLLNMLPKQQL